MPKTRTDTDIANDVPSEDGQSQLEEDKAEFLAPMSESNDKTTTPATRAARKRGREGSTEPGAVIASASSSTASMHRLAVKKNRVEPSSSTTAGSQQLTDDDTPQPTTVSTDPSNVDHEAGNVGEVRKKVAKMNWKEGAAGKKIRAKADDAMSVASERGVDEVPEEDEDEDEDEVEDADIGDKGKEDAEDSSGEAVDERQVESKGDSIEDHKMTTSTSGSSPTADHHMQQDQSVAVSDNETQEDAVIQDGESITPAAVNKKSKSATSPASDAMDTDPEAGKKRKLLERHSSTALSTTTGTDGEDTAKRLKETSTLETSVDPDNKGETSLKDVPEADATPKKSQPTFALFSSTASPFGVKPSTTTTGLTTSISNSDSSLSSTPAPAPKKPPATFGSFSSSASPFATIKQTSAFSSQPVASSSTSAPFKSTSNKAFGGWSVSSGASPFATPVKKKNDEAKEVDDDEQEVVKPSGSFEDILTSSKAEEEKKTAKVAVKAQEHRTGEEDENTVYQVRCKLYVMEKNGSWRERGTGSLHLNTRRDDTRAARLVMRAEGVLRLILNVALFPGMTCEITGDKYLKTVVMESGELKSFLIKVGSTKAANELKQQILDYIPETSKPLSEEAPSPEPEREAVEDAEAKV